MDCNAAADLLRYNAIGGLTTMRRPGFSLVALIAALVAMTSVAIQVDSIARAQSATNPLESAANPLAFEKNCSECHTLAEAVDLARAKAFDDPAKALETYLARHHARAAAERRAVIALLVAELSRPP